MTTSGKATAKPPAATVAPGKPTATVIIEPRGGGQDGVRQHVVELALALRDGDDKPRAVALVEEALAAFTSAPGTRANIGEIIVKAGAKTSGIAGGIVLAGPPDEAAISALRATLAAAGFSVSVEELRSCSQCTATVMAAWSRPAPTPPGWHDPIICGKHHYKRCGSCNSVYVMSCDNVSGPAPSLHCVVCSAVLVEWGGTKRWYAELVSSG